MSMDEEDDVEFIDAENYVPEPKGAKTYEQIVLEQISRCVSEGSKEMVGGYFREKATRMGIQEIYVPDQRQVYLQCIMSLYDLLLPFFDDIMNEYLKTFNNQLINIKESKIKALNEKVKYIDDGRLRWSIQQQIDTGYLDPDSVEAKQAMDEKLETYRFLYQQLLLLFGRKRYLMAQAIED